MEVKYETEKKELEIAHQQTIIKKHKMQRGIFIGGIALCAIILALLWYLLRMRTRRNHILAEINATKDKFFNIISHDLKNPAIAQRDALKMLINNISSIDAAQIVEYLNEILSSAEGEVVLLYNLLNWAQMQTGRMAFMPDTINLVSCLRPEVALTQEIAKAKNITLISQIPDEALVTADRNMIAAIVRNLLTNAVKFTHAGGKVTLDIVRKREEEKGRRGEGRKGEGEKGERYVVSVCDTGVGMGESQIRNLFCLDTARSTKGTANESGSGLGLIVCKELVEKHGSTLHIESEAGKGSKFWFEIKKI
jgi:signal transduction histidine kinase